MASGRSARIIHSGRSEGRATPRGTITFLGIVAEGDETITFTEDVGMQIPGERLLFLVGATVWSPDSSGDITINQGTFGDIEGVTGACWKIGEALCGFTTPIDFSHGYSAPSGSGPGAGFHFRAYTCSVRKTYKAGDTIALPTTGSVGSVQTFIALFARAGDENDEGVEGTSLSHAEDDDGCSGGYVEDAASVAFDIEHLYVGVTYAIGSHEVAVQSPGRFLPLREAFDPGTPSWSLTDLVNSEGVATEDYGSALDGHDFEDSVARIYWGFKIVAAGNLPDAHAQWACPGTWSISELPGGPFADSMAVALHNGYVPQNDTAPCCPRGIIVSDKFRARGDDNLPGIV